MCERRSLVVVSDRNGQETEQCVSKQVARGSV